MQKLKHLHAVGVTIDYVTTTENSRVVLLKLKTGLIYNLVIPLLCVCSK